MNICPKPGTSTHKGQGVDDVLGVLVIKRRTILSNRLLLANSDFSKKKRHTDTSGRASSTLIVNRVRAGMIFCMFSRGKPFTVVWGIGTTYIHSTLIDLECRGGKRSQTRLLSWWSTPWGRPWLLYRMDWWEEVQRSQCWRQRGEKEKARGLNWRISWYWENEETIRPFITGPAWLSRDMPRRWSRSSSSLFELKVMVYTIS